MTVLLLFQFGFLLFPFLLWLLWPGLPKLCWIKVARVPDLRGSTVRFSLLNMMLAMGLPCMTFIGLRYVSCMAGFWGFFIVNGCWILLKCFSTSIVLIIWFLFFNLLMWYITLIFMDIEKSLGWTPSKYSKTQETYSFVSKLSVLHVPCDLERMSFVYLLGAVFYCGASHIAQW